MGVSIVFVLNDANEAESIHILDILIKFLRCSLTSISIFCLIKILFIYQLHFLWGRLENYHFYYGNLLKKPTNNEILKNAKSRPWSRDNIKENDFYPQRLV